MTKRDGAAKAAPSPARDAAPTIQVTIGRDAANQGGETITVTEESVESLLAKHGAPAPAFTALAFSTWEPNESLALGRKVATERILGAVPGFVQSVSVSWGGLSEAQRASVLGYHPAMLSVLLDETVKLRAINHRYDARARAEGMSRDARAGAAADALQTGRSLGERVLRGARQWAPAAHLREAPLPAGVEGVDSPEALAATLDTLGSWYATWRSTWGEAERAGYEALRFTATLDGELHGAATRVRKTQEALAAAAELTPATQRELDAQDGRVLHVVGKVYAAFRSAAKEDPGVVVPSLGRLATVFERTRAKGAADEAKPDEPAKPEEPAKPAGDPKPDA